MGQDTELLHSKKKKSTNGDINWLMRLFSCIFSERTLGEHALVGRLTKCFFCFVNRN
jgi:hypothetical protein